MQESQRVAASAINCSEVPGKMNFFSELTEAKKMRCVVYLSIVSSSSSSSLARLPFMIPGLPNFFLFLNSLIFTV
jgi:hypothetical protein